MIRSLATIEILGWALAFGLARLRWLRSPHAERFRAWCRSHALFWWSIVCAFEAIFIDKRGRVRKRRDIERDMVQRLALYTEAMVHVNQWVVENRWRR